MNLITEFIANKKIVVRIEVSKLIELLHKFVVQHFVVQLVAPDPKPEETVPGIQVDAHALAVPPEAITV